MASPPSVYTGSSRLMGSTTDSSAAVTSRRVSPALWAISSMVGSRPSCFFQRLAALHGPVGGIPQAAAHPQGVVIPQKAPDLANDHGHAVGGEPHRLGGVKMIDGLDKPDAPHLKQIVQIFRRAGRTAALR